MNPKSLAIYIIDTNDSILAERRAEAIDFVNAQADEITTLRAQLAEAREIIKPFTHESLSEQLSGNTIGDDSVVFGRNKAELTLGDFRAARAWYTKVTTA